MRSPQRPGKLRRPSANWGLCLGPRTASWQDDGSPSRPLDTAASLLPKAMSKGRSEGAGLWPLVNKAPRCLIWAQNHFSLLVFRVRSGTQLRLSAVIKASNCWDGSFRRRDEPHVPNRLGRPSPPGGGPDNPASAAPSRWGQARCALCPVPGAGLGWPERGEDEAQNSRSDGWMGRWWRGEKASRWDKSEARRRVMEEVTTW